VILRFFLKIAVSAVILTLVSEVSKRTSWVGGLIASLPLTSLLALVWLYIDTKDLSKISALSWDIFWFVLPSLSFFIALPLFIEKLKFGFWWSLLLSAVITGAAYWVFGKVIALFKPS
jgi:uncharacterized membrane protein (GlpM family)